jgi:hypothetical protein
MIRPHDRETECRARRAIGAREGLLETLDVAGRNARSATSTATSSPCRVVVTSSGARP